MGIAASFLCTPFLFLSIFVLFVPFANLDYGYHLTFTPSDVLMALLVWPALILGFTGGLLALDDRRRGRVYAGFFMMIFFGVVVTFSQAWTTDFSSLTSVGLLILAMSSAGLVLFRLEDTHYNLG